MFAGDGVQGGKREPRNGSQAPVETPLRGNSPRPTAARRSAEAPKPASAEMPVVRPTPRPEAQNTIQRYAATLEDTMDAASVQPIEAVAPAAAASGKAPDPAELARLVYPIIKRMLAVEKERYHGRSY